MCTGILIASMGARGVRMLNKLNKVFLGKAAIELKEQKLYFPDKAGEVGDINKKCFFVKGIGEIELVEDIDIAQMLDESIQADISLNEINVIEEDKPDTEFYIYALNRPVCRQTGRIFPEPFSKIPNLPGNFPN